MVSAAACKRHKTGVGRVFAVIPSKTRTGDLALCFRRQEPSLRVGSPPEAGIARRLGQPSMADSPPAHIPVRCGQSPLRAAPFVCVRPCFSYWSKGRSMKLHEARPPDCRGYAPSAPNSGVTAGAAATAPYGAFEREWMRAPACGSGADVQAAGHTPDSPVAPARSDRFDSKESCKRDPAHADNDQKLQRTSDLSINLNDHALSFCSSQLLGSPAP